jgi:putative ABC transport system substrate-binding protein
MFGHKRAVEAGGFMGYEANPTEMYKRAAALVDKILKGAKPADLPVEFPTRFLFAINLKTAKTLGVTVPPTLLATADEVIE